MEGHGGGEAQGVADPKKTLLSQRANARVFTYNMSSSLGVKLAPRGKVVP
jgi:hypothetical protein